MHLRAELVWFTELRLALDVGGTDAGSFLCEVLGRPLHAMASGPAHVMA